MAPPHLHPRSRMTSSLFATTVLVSFCVVTLPHVLPCPAPRITRYDGDMGPEGACAPGRRRRRRRPDGTETDVAGAPPGASTARRTTANGVVRWETDKDMTAARPRRVVEKRECPVPKPAGVIGKLLGFKKDSKSTGSGSDGEGPKDASRPGR